MIVFFIYTISCFAVVGSACEHWQNLNIPPIKNFSIFCNRLHEFVVKVVDYCVYC